MNAVCIEPRLRSIFGQVIAKLFTRNLHHSPPAAGEENGLKEKFSSPISDIMRIFYNDWIISKAFFTPAINATNNICSKCVCSDRAFGYVIAVPVITYVRTFHNELHVRIFYSNKMPCIVLGLYVIEENKVRHIKAE